MTDDTTNNDDESDETQSNDMNVEAVDDAGASDESDESDVCEVCGEPHADHAEQSGEELRDELVDELKQADGAVVVAARDGGDGVAITASNFMLDSLDDEEKRYIHGALNDGLDELLDGPAANGGVGMAAIDASEMPPELRAALDSLLDDLDDDGPGGMFR